MCAPLSDILDRLRNCLTTQSTAETEQIARDFSKCVPHGSVLAFHGDLGAGKTTFIRGMARAWGIEEPVTSPTFNLYSIYQGQRQLIHVDAYRLEQGADLESLMIEDFMHSPWCLAIEWPERVAASLPEDTWHLYLGINEAREHTIRLA